MTDDKKTKVLTEAEMWQENQKIFIARIWKRLNTALVETKEEMESDGLTVDMIYGPISLQCFIGAWVQNNIQEQARMPVFEDLVTGFAHQLGISTYKDEKDEERIIH